MTFEMHLYTRGVYLCSGDETHVMGENNNKKAFRNDKIMIMDK